MAIPKNSNSSARVLGWSNVGHEVGKSANNAADKIAEAVTYLFSTEPGRQVSNSVRRDGASLWQYVMRASV